MPESRFRRVFGSAIALPLNILLALTIAVTLAALIVTLCSKPGQCQQPAIAPLPDPVGDAITCPPRGLTLDGRVINIVDGDTIDVETRVVYRIRLLDCWAPESRTTDPVEKARGLQSKQRMLDLADGRSVRVFVPIDSGDLSDLLTLGRVLGHVWPLDDTGRPQLVSLSARMVAEGYATAAKQPIVDRKGKR